MNLMVRELCRLANASCMGTEGTAPTVDSQVDMYFSVDVETDGPIPGPYSMLSFAIVYAGCFDGNSFIRPKNYDKFMYRELKPISDTYEPEALEVNGLDRNRLSSEGSDPTTAMLEAYEWVAQHAGSGSPIFVAYPLSFDWPWMNWYFNRYCRKGSPFGFSRAFDIKTAIAIKAGLPISRSGKSNIPDKLKSKFLHTHNALDDAIEQADVFGNLFGFPHHDIDK